MGQTRPKPGDTTLSQRHAGAQHTRDARTSEARALAVPQVTALLPGAIALLLAALTLLMALAGPVAARNICHTGLTGVTVCTDRSVSRSSLQGRYIDNAGNISHRTIMGVALSNDHTARRIDFGSAGGLHEADGRLWNTDAFPAATGAIGGVACDTATRAHPFCP